MNAHHFNAVIFDLDGVITDTSATHSAAWKQMFDEFLKSHAERTKTPFREFTHENDYLPYVDGKPRYQGVESFLASRGIELPFGDPDDEAGKLTVCGLGNRKNDLFNQSIKKGKINVYQSTVDFIRQLRTEGIRVGVASSSKNAKTVLETVGVLGLIETLVDGVVSAELGLKGKPQADIFTKACDNLGVFYDHAVIVEDAIPGVQAGQNGGFGLVIGVAREENSLELKLNGADLVVKDLAELDIQQIENWLTKRLAEEQWSISYFDYHLGWEGTRETLLSVGNGYFGTRGAQEETSASKRNYPGTYIAGLYNRLKSEVGGRTVVNEDFVNCPNWLPVTFKIADGDWFDPNQTKILHITRQLDFHTGVLYRSMVVADEHGHETRLESHRLASMDEPHLAALRYQIIPLNYDEIITIRSMLDGDITNAGVARYQDLSSKHLTPVRGVSKGNRSSLLVQTNQSNIQIAEAARLLVAVNGREVKPDFETVYTSGQVTTTFEVDAERGVAVTVDKLVAIYASHQEQVADPLAAAQESLADQYSFDLIRHTSATAWDRIWEKIDIQIEGDRTSQKLIRLHLYHTMITASPHNENLDAGLPARGLHGEAYRGHIFWDELYVLPFFDLHFPATARSALMYRYNRLGGAQKYAHENGYQGAMFPWQSGSDGSEETQTLHLNPLSDEWGPDYSQLQRHVSLAVAHNIWEYLWVTEDLEFLEKYGAEMFLEICRFWVSKSSLNETRGRYEIDQVMGPDEFHEKYPGADMGGLKNNSYTNILVAWILQRVFDLLEKMSASARKALAEKIRLTEAELAHWREIAQKLYVSISNDGILEQFEGYFDLKELDWAHYQHKYENIHRMDRILKSEGKSPDEYKVAKQADALMTFYLLTEEQVKGILNDLGYSPPENFLHDNFYYYLSRTSHGSTLSRLVHAYLAHILGDSNLSWQLYTEALKSDYTDLQGGTTKEGIHAGVMTGTVLFALRAFAGLNHSGEMFKLNPKLPATWRSMRFGVDFKGDRYYFSIAPEIIQIKLEGTKEKTISVRGKEIPLQPDQWIEVR
jgi:HAD superfamily hydrolase (TIGR01509 family)